MPFPLLAALIPVIKIVATCVCVGAGCHVCKKGIDAYNKSQKVKLRNIERKSKADDAKIKAATEDNKRLQQENEELKKNIANQDKQNQETTKEIQSIKKELDDPNISKEREEELRSRLGFLQTQLDEGNNKLRNWLKKLQGNDSQMNKNNQVINSTGSDNLNDRHWIWEFLTLENILICLAIYAVWKIVRDEQR